MCVFSRVLRLCRTRYADETETTTSASKSNSPFVKVNKALWPSGKAKVCNTSIPGSIPGGASKKKSTS